MTSSVAIDSAVRSPSRSPKPVRSPRSLFLVLAAAALPFVLIGCGEAEGPAVAELTIEPREVTLPHTSYRDVQAEWSLASELEGAAGPVRVFVHLLDEEGRLARTFDHPMPGGWAQGEERSYPVRIYQSALAPPLPPGEYSLSFGLYDGEGNRWPIDVEGERVGEGEYVVARVAVPERPAAVPTIGFSQGWSPTLAGADRQVLAVRWLTGGGAILLEDVEEAGSLWIQLRIPSAGDGAARRIFRDSEGREEVPSVRLAAPCSGFEASISGQGEHGVEIPVVSEDGSCPVHLEPNYAMVAEGLEQQTVLLQNVAWAGRE